MPKRRIKTLLKRNLKLSHRDAVMLLIGAALAFLAFRAIDTMQSAMTPLGAREPEAMSLAHLPAEVQQWEDPLMEMSHKYDIDATFVAIIMTIESRGNPDAVSHVGAQGLMQIMPYTAEDIAAKHLKQPMTEYNLTEPRTNIEFGVAYLAYLRDQFGDFHQERTVKMIAAGYNGGPGAALRLQKGQQLHPETADYIEKVAQLWEKRG